MVDWKKLEAAVHQWSVDQECDDHGAPHDIPALVRVVRECVEPEAGPLVISGMDAAELEQLEVEHGKPGTVQVMAPDGGEARSALAQLVAAWEHYNATMNGQAISLENLVQASKAHDEAVAVAEAILARTAPKAQKTNGGELEAAGGGNP